ncbi:MAG: glycine/betaine ABC transporter substrate-binding protein [Actinomycetes bacterium]|jgi:osmoprotectant transport system substrate-binding protein|nr:glycine/betaine ABC transporter substrate-binding protein [Actinomycetes bacterium]
MFSLVRRLSKRKELLLILGTLLLVAGIVGCSKGATPDTGDGTGAEDAAPAEASGEPVKVGSKDFTENLILGEVYALALENAGIPVQRNLGLASSAVHQTLISGDIDLYPEYTGTGLLSVLQLPLETDPQKVYDTVKDEYKKQFDLVWLDYAPANDGQGLVVTKALSDKYGITNISEFQQNAAQIRFASQGEFDEREDGIPALVKVYGPLKFKSSKVYDNSLKYEILAKDEADAAPAYTTEGQLIQPEFVLLDDDKQVWPPYNIAPVVRQATLDAYPQIAEVLNGIAAGLTTEKVTELNAKVDVEGQEYEEVAADYFNSIK